MKRLTCELCGSTNIVKQDGMFVCQECGAKYSVEEAKKMMVEESADVSGGKVKVETSNRLKNLYILAHRAKDDNNTEDAAKYYSEIRLEDPNSWEAAFYGVYYTAMNCKIAQIESAALSVKNCLDSVSNLILEYVPKEEQKAAYTECLLSAAHIGTLLFNASKNTYMNSNYSDKAKDFLDRALSSILTINTAGATASETFDDVFLAKQIHENCADMCRSFWLSSGFAPISEEAIEKLQPRLAAAQKKKNDEYWEAHAEEKANLEKEKDQLLSEEQNLKDQIVELENKKDSVPAKAEYEELNNRLNELKKQKDALGLFKNKEKKALQDQIESLTQSFKKCRSELDAQKKVFVDKMNPLESRIKDIDIRLQEIETELNKDR